MRSSDIQLKVRIPPELKAWLAARAASNGRSRTSEIVQILKQERERCERQPKAA